MSCCKCKKKCESFNVLTETLTSTFYMIAGFLLRPNIGEDEDSYPTHWFVWGAGGMEEPYRAENTEVRIDPATGYKLWDEDYSEEEFRNFLISRVPIAESKLSTISEIKINKDGCAYRTHRIVTFSHLNYDPSDLDLHGTMHQEFRDIGE